MVEYEVVPHTADHKIFAYGITYEELFRNALRGMFATIKPQSPQITYNGDELQVRYTVERHIVIHAPERELLLIDFLSECLYLSAIHHEAYLDARFKSLEETELEGIIYGVPITRYEVVEIKAVTYHDLQFEEINGIWRATIVFDI